MVIRFKEFGISLGTRELGKKIRSQAVSFFANDGKVVFDFSGVELVSNSFADECFGKLIVEHGLEVTKSKTTFFNANETVSLVIKKAINDRIKKCAQEVCSC